MLERWYVVAFRGFRIGRIGALQREDECSYLAAFIGCHHSIPGRHALVQYACRDHVIDRGRLGVAHPVLIRQVRPDEPLPLIAVARLSVGCKQLLASRHGGRIFRQSKQGAVV